MKLYLDEAGSDDAREVWESELAVSTSEISQVELSCALAAAIRGRRLQAGRLEVAVCDGTALWERAEAVTVDSDILRSASRLGATHGLRALDALHIASALVLMEASPTLVSWDLNQRRAARAEGLPVYPELDEGMTAALR